MMTFNVRTSREGNVYLAVENSGNPAERLWSLRACRVFHLGKWGSVGLYLYNDVICESRRAIMNLPSRHLTRGESPSAFLVVLLAAISLPVFI